jgi:hypothetical protein
LTQSSILRVAPMDSKRAQYLRRRALGRRLLPGVREFLRGALARGDMLELASWEDSDATYTVFEREWATARAGRGRPEVLSHLGRCRLTMVKYIAEHRGDLPAHGELLLFLPQWHACGAVKIDVGEALDDAERLVRLDQQDLLACNSAGTVGVVLEWFYDGPRGETMYRFLAWNYL